MNMIVFYDGQIKTQFSAKNNAIGFHPEITEATDERTKNSLFSVGSVAQFLSVAAQQI